jgi:signal peptidase
MPLSLIRHSRRAVGVVGFALFVVVAGFSLFIHVAPLTGRELFTVVGGSMEPAIPTGSLIVATPVDEQKVAAGDVLTFRSDSGSAVVTHRVVRVVVQADGTSFETKGDANRDPDAGLVPARAIVGAADLYMPYAGYAKAFLSSPPGLVAALSVLGALLLVYMLLEMIERPARATPAQGREPIGP